jgi:outer membrane beta-barrel protein
MRCIIAGAAVLLLATGAMAQDEGGESTDSDLASEDAETAEIEEETLKLRDRIRAVSGSSFLKQGRFELEPFGGITTSDAFFRRWTAGARASYFIVEGLSIDAGGAVNVFNQALTPVFLVDGSAPVFDDDEQILAYGDVGVAFSPFYGKMAVMSEWVLHFDAFATLGGGAVVAQGGGQVDPALEVGGGARMVLNRGMALRADVRNYLTVGGGLVNNLIVFNLGVSIFFPFDFENTDRGTKDTEG